MSEVTGVATVRRQEETGHGVVVHYHEIGLKGRNRGTFERQLVRNLTSSLQGCHHLGVENLTGRLVVGTEGPPAEALLDRVARTFGVAFFAPAAIVPSDLHHLERSALELVSGREFSTFAIATRRATKEHPLNSRQINVELGAAVEKATGAGVDLSNPEATVRVEVVGPRAFVYVDRRPGPGGLPVGVSGKVVSLLSGGIDSPVATYRVLKRGAKAILCHFHSAPFTDRSSERKAIELGRMLAELQGKTTLYLVPLGEAQQQIVLSAPPQLRVVLYRRLMMRVAEQVARRQGAKALVTGDSLGQVASQTLENLACADHVATLPVLRPLVGEDKQDIVDEAKAIGTYETSILPFEDCCSLFVPSSPATRASVEECQAAEESLDIDTLVGMCCSQAVVEHLIPPACGEVRG